MREGITSVAIVFLFGSVAGTDCPAGKWGPDCALDNGCEYGGYRRRQEYQGTLNIASNGQECIPWDDTGFASVTFWSGLPPLVSTERENYCRWPTWAYRDIPRAFCYTYVGSKVFRTECNVEHCACPNGKSGSQCTIPVAQNPCTNGKWGPDCNLDEKCYYNGKEEEYLGFLRTTQSGKPCIRWDESKYYNSNPPYFANMTVLDDFCRAPWGSQHGDDPWCPTADDGWEYCGVVDCGEAPPSPTVPPTTTQPPTTETPTTTAPPSECEDGWEYVASADRCFKLTASLAFDDAAQACLGDGSELVEYQTPEAATALSGLKAFTKKAQYWIGFKRTDDKTPWRWISDDTQVTKARDLKRIFGKNAKSKARNNCASARSLKRRPKARAQKCSRLFPGLCVKDKLSS